MLLLRRRRKSHQVDSVVNDFRLAERQSQLEVLPLPKPAAENDAIELHIIDSHGIQPVRVGPSKRGSKRGLYRLLQETRARTQPDPPKLIALFQVSRNPEILYVENDRALRLAQHDVERREKLQHAPRVDHIRIPLLQMMKQGSAIVILPPCKLQRAGRILRS